MEQPWHVLTKTLVLDRSPFLRVWSEVVRLTNGTIIPDWTRLEMPDYALVFAVTPQRTVPMIRNYKHGAGCTMVNLPGGYMARDEDPLVAAQRELLEETGLVSCQWTLLARYVADSNREAGWGYIYLARDAEPQAEPDAGDLEQIELFFHPLDQIRALWRSSEMVQFAASAGIALALDELERVPG